MPRILDWVLPEIPVGSMLRLNGSSSWMPMTCWKLDGACTRNLPRAHTTLWLLWHPYSEWDGSEAAPSNGSPLKATDLVTKRLPLSPSGSLIRRPFWRRLGDGVYPRPGRRHRSMDASVASGASASVMVQYSLDEVPHQRRSTKDVEAMPRRFCTTR